MNNDLPPLILTDDDFARSGWQPDEGWNGLIPVKSNIHDAITLLGPVCGENRLSNATTYDFAEGLVRLTVRAGQTAIAKVWVSASASGRFPKVPQKLSEAGTLFGGLRFAVRHRGYDTYERPGLRVLCLRSLDDSLIQSLEFFRNF